MPDNNIKNHFSTITYVTGGPEDDVNLKVTINSSAMDISDSIYTDIAGNTKNYQDEFTVPVGKSIDLRGKKINIHTAVSVTNKFPFTSVITYFLTGGVKPSSPSNNGTSTDGNPIFFDADIYFL